jgi:hypothetical protein
MEEAKEATEAKVDTEAEEDTEEVMEDMAATGRSNCLKNALIFFKDFLIKKGNYRTSFTWNLCSKL